MSSPIEINILGKSYQVSCQEEEKEALITAAVELNRRMQSIQRQSGVVGHERIAIMVALNLCHELQKTNDSVTPDAKRDEIIERLANKLNEAQQTLCDA